MARKKRIVIADRNRSLRSFFQRELAADGFEVFGVADEHSLLGVLRTEEPIDLLILDADLPTYSTLAELVSMLHLHFPQLPIILQTFFAQDFKGANLDEIALLVEKGEDPLTLKRAIFALLNRSAAPPSYEHGDRG